jgi:hypothetical protein
MLSLLLGVNRKHIVVLFHAPVADPDRFMRLFGLTTSERLSVFSGRKHTLLVFVHPFQVFHSYYLLPFHKEAPTYNP